MKYYTMARIKHFWRDYHKEIWWMIYLSYNKASAYHRSCLWLKILVTSLNIELGYFAIINDLRIVRRVYFENLQKIIYLVIDIELLWTSSYLDYRKALCREITSKTSKERNCWHIHLKNGDRKIMQPIRITRGPVKRMRK